MCITLSIRHSVNRILIGKKTRRIARGLSFPILLEQAPAKHYVIFGGSRRLEIVEVFGQPLERPPPPSSVFGIWEVMAIVKNGALDGRKFVSLLPSGGRPSAVTVKKHLEG
jgi:hypothetical protein